MGKETILKGNDLFASLTVDEIHKVSTFSSTKEFRKNETIFEYDKASSHFYMLMEGEVYLQLPAKPSEFSFAVSKVEKGELFGISPLLKSSRYTSTAKCYRDTKVLSIEAKPFRDLLRMNCPAGLDIVNKVAHIYFTRYLDVIKRLQSAVGPVTLQD